MPNASYGRAPQPGDAGYVWVLSISYDGQELRWASRDLAVTGLPQGGRLLPGLEADSVEQQVALDGQGRAAAMSFDVYFPAEAPVAALESAGGRLAGSDGELALVPTTATDDGATADWRDRFVVLRGFVSRPTYGDQAEPVSFDLAPYELDDRAVMPKSTYRVDSDTWPNAPDDAVGLVYPAPFGQPGVFEFTSGSQYVPATPALIVKSATGTGPGGAAALLVDTLLIAWGAVAATSVRLWYEADPDNNRWSSVQVSVTETTDGLGQTVSVLDVTGESALLRVAPRFACDWRYGAGKMLSPAQAIQTVADVVTWMMRHSSVPVDWGRLSAGLAPLSDIEVAGYIDDTVSPLDWVSDRILGVLPVSREDGAEGVALRAIRYWAGQGHAVSDMVVGAEDRRRVEREGRIETTQDGRFTEVRVRWGWAQPWEKYTQLTVVRADALGALDAIDERIPAGTVPSVDRVQEVELPDCYSQAAALAHARWMLWLHGRPKRSLDVTCDVEVFGFLQRYDVVTFTDASLSLSRVPCLVEAVERDDGPQLHLRLLLLG